jgi:hypothetical protein
MLVIEGCSEPVQIVPTQDGFGLSCDLTDWTTPVQTIRVFLGLQSIRLINYGDQSISFSVCAQQSDSTGTIPCYSSQARSCAAGATCYVQAPVGTTVNVQKPAGEDTAWYLSTDGGTTYSSGGDATFSFPVTQAPAGIILYNYPNFW